ncbi:lysozyme inhibitor LprI family protein [Dyella sp.]|uniref:lysozyme inhibitor LprI family protein n=1 Tax=Dyella sp. TaxID=1869338 RepID=UPI002B4665F3|nr:lysozyme inhibitor LprI family protein [Dyella sp.]HKT27297.1 lysozyme inhibitor LprI family protein [Dyella sp.]
MRVEVGVRMSSRGHLFFLLITLVTTCAACQAASLPDALIGRWQVIEVHINTNATAKTNYGWNDARLRWRIFTFTSTELSNDAADGSNCEAPQVAVTNMPAMRLMDDSLAHTGGSASDPEAHPSPTAYELKIDPNELVKVISVHCKDGLWEGDLGTGKGVEGAWMFFTHSGQLVIRWRDETLLVLDRLPADAKPRPSFDCLHARSPAEKTICGSLQLAAFDRSVNWSYKVTRDDIKDTDVSSAQLAGSQRAWLRKRDACGTNASCLLSVMQRRLEELSSYP